MSLFGRISLCLFTAAVLVAANGCSPGDGAGQAVEEEEPHYVLGNSRCNERDWTGAIEAFEESLEVNPHSAQAHYRLAQLFDVQEPDPAAAIYHYQEYLKLEPDAKNRDIINQRIDSCKQQLATDVMQLPSAPALQKQLDSLVTQNRQLQSEVDQLTAQLRGWNVYYASVQAAQKAAGSAATYVAPAQTPTTSTTPDDISSQSAQPVQPSTDPRPAPTTTTVVNPPRSAPQHVAREHNHVVTSGETMAAIARKHGLSLTALEAANPDLNPRKLHVGQIVNLPP